MLFNEVNNSFTNENPVLIKILTDILKRLFQIGNKRFNKNILDLVKQNFEVPPPLFPTPPITPLLEPQGSLQSQSQAEEPPRTPVENQRPPQKDTNEFICRDKHPQGVLPDQPRERRPEDPQPQCLCREVPPGDQQGGL